MTAGKYTLYGRRGAGSLAPQILLEEIGAPYELVWISKAPADLEVLRRVNPAAKIPSLVLPDGTAVAESAAMVFLSANLYEAILRYYYAERYSTAGAAAAPAIKAQALADYAAHLERIHRELSPYVLGERYSAADPYLHMLAAWYPEAERPLAARLPKLAQHAELLRQRQATRTAEREHAED